MKMADVEFRVQERKRNLEENGLSKRITRIVPKSMSSKTLDKVSQLVPADRGRSQKQELMETAILEKTIIKLGSLLALGFGEAGAKIIANNMRGVDTAGVN